jgi:hypothetical protein
VLPKTHLLYFALFYRAIVAFVGEKKRLASGLQWEQVRRLEVSAGLKIKIKSL